MDKMGEGCVSYAVISYDPGSYWSLVEVVD
jgi:hypothetical protein